MRTVAGSRNVFWSSFMKKFIQTGVFALLGAINLHAQETKIELAPNLRISLTANWKVLSRVTDATQPNGHIKSTAAQAGTLLLTASRADSGRHANAALFQ